MSMVKHLAQVPARGHSDLRVAIGPAVLAANDGLLADGLGIRPLSIALNGIVVVRLSIAVAGIRVLRVRAPLSFPIPRNDVI